MNAMTRNVIIVGAGPAGLGQALALKRAGIPDVLILDARGIGASFRAWPQETRLLTPSFPSQAYGCPDLNSVFPEASPADRFVCEHISGPQYADWLNQEARRAGLDVACPVHVKAVDREDGLFELDTDQGMFRCRVLVWATGEFFFPSRHEYPGAELCVHYADVKSWRDCEGDQLLVIGGAESGIDAACNLIALGKKVTVLDRGGAWMEEQGDPSLVLSPHTRTRFRAALDSGRLRMVPDVSVVRVGDHGDGFRVYGQDGQSFACDGPPISCIGFVGGASQIRDLWAWRNGQVLLTPEDESTLTPGLFLAGPQVRQPGEIFCFIYKFRTRFDIVCHAISQRLRENESVPHLESFASHASGV
ncbi:MAG: NAD(P)-binding domain-containing protein [Verrucomicrobia bacterium]|nr:NAD(P)-binding domain-containing protein [Verrucomicrobiota bacterium]MCH8512894.1 NAD(P)-binding domain-containing protein [Kiritimatiellia bacterium]